MTLRQLKLFATITPAVAIVAIELARYSIIGPLAVWQRIALDLVAIAALVDFLDRDLPVRRPDAGPAGAPQSRAAGAAQRRPRRGRRSCR